MTERPTDRIYSRLVQMQMKLFRPIDQKWCHYRPIDERNVIIRLRFSFFGSCYYATTRRLAREAAQTTRRLEKLHKERHFYILVSWKIGGEVLVLLSICNLVFPPTNRTMITPITLSRKAKLASRPSVETLRLVKFGLFQHFETTTFVTCAFPPITTTTMKTSREVAQTTTRLEKLYKQTDA